MGHLQHAAQLDETVPISTARRFLSRFHRTGMGYALMNLAISKAVAKGANRLVLGVHDENARVLAFYKRQGFEAINSRKFHVYESVFCDAVLARTLR